MAFKDIIAEDLDTVFFNTDEFAEEIIIDGMPVLVVRANIKYNPYEDKSVNKTNIYGLAENYQAFYVKNNHGLDLYIGKQVNVNNKDFFIDNIIEDIGITKIILSVTEAR